MTIKLSYTILKNWEMGRFEEAIGQYLGKPLPGSSYMELGKLKHTLWEQYTLQNKAIHPELGGGKLVNPIVEQKYEKRLPFSDDIEILFRGIIDLEDQNIARDYKCGMTTPSSYVDGWQLDAYKLLRPNLKEGHYICFNPYLETRSIGVKFLTDDNAENALNHIMTAGGEIINYLQVNKLIIDFKEE